MVGFIFSFLKIFYLFIYLFTLAALGLFFFLKEFLYFYFYLFIYYYFFFAVLGLRFCARAFPSCGKREPLFIAVRGPLTIVASLVAEHKLQTCRLSSCGSWAQPLRGMWDLPRPGLEPASPALAGRFSTTVPPGKPCTQIFKHAILSFVLMLLQNEDFQEDS